MTNFDTAREALEVSANSAGSAMQEHAKWSESLEARLLKLKATWQSLSQSLMKSDFLKGLLNGVTGLVDGFDKLISTFGTLPTLLTAFAAFKSFSGGGFFRTIKDEATGAATGITNVFKQSANSINQSLSSINVKTGFRGFLNDNDVASLRNYQNALNKGVSSGVAWNNCMTNASDVAKEAARSNEFLSKGLNGYIKSQAQAEISTIAQNKSLGNARAIIKEYNSATKETGNVCKQTGMSQKDFAAAVSKTNPQLATQLTTAKSAKGAMAGYITSMVGAKAATIALQATTMAMNMALTMGISALISWGISKLDEWIETADELKERIEEVTSKYKEQHDEMMKLKGDYDTSNEDSMISKYGKLSKGVDSLGENISLTADEYAEYQSIVETIAEQIPSLVTGYNSQGDAILSCAGSVDKLSESYKNLIKEQNGEVLKTGSDIFEDFNNDMDEQLRSQGIKGERLVSFTGTATSHLEALEELFKSKDIESAVNNLSSGELERIANLLEDSGIERDVLGSGEKGFENYKEFIIRAVKENASEAKSALTTAFDDINAHVEDLNAYTESYFSTAFLGGDEDLGVGDFSGFSDKMQNIISKVTSGFDASFYEQFDNVDELETEFNNILTSFNNLTSGEKAELEAAFDLQTKFNGGEISYGEYVNGLQNVSGIIDSLKLDEEIESQIKISLGLSEKDGKWVVEEYESLLNRLTSKEYEIQLDTDSAKSFLDNLNSEELDVAVNFIEEGNEDFNKALQNYKDVLDEAKEAGVDFSKTSFGNIDTNARKVLEWNSENLKKYKDELMSFEPEDAKWDDVKKGYEDTISTVMGMWDTFKIGGKDVDIAFSPMLQTSDGAEVLSSDTVNTYIEKLIGKATEDGKWTNEELLKLDAEGIEIDGQRIKGILADIGDTAEETSIQMHFVGEDGALALAEKEAFSILEEQVKLDNAMTYTIPISAELEWTETLNNALGESYSATGLASESIEALKSRYQELEEYDAGKLFENTAHGVKLNTDAVRELESALESQTKEETKSHLETLENEYNRLTTEIENASNTADRADFYAQRDDVVAQIEEISSLASQYEGLTSAYNEWLNAQEAADKGDTHSQIMSSMESAEELKESGYVGTNEFRTSAQFLSYDDLSNVDIDTVVDKWVAGKKKFDKYFTEDKSGTNAFLKDLNAINESWAKFENDEWVVDIDVEEAAKEMGVSTSFIMGMLDELEARGIKVNYDENDGLEKFKTHAEEAQEAYNKIMGENGEKKIEFKFGTGNLNTVNSQLDEAKLLYDTITTKDGKVNLDAEGAEEVRTIILSLIQEKQKLEKPAIMDVKVDAESAKTDVGKATQAVQNLQNNLWKLEQSTYDPSINSAEIQTEISNIIGTLNTLEQSDPEIYAKLGLDETQITNLKTAIEGIQADIKAGVEPSQEDIATVQSTIKGIDATVVANVLTGDLNSTTGTATITPKPSTTDLGDGFTGNATITPNPSTLDLGTKFIGEGTISVSPNKTNLGSNFTGSGTINLTPNPTSLSVTVTGTGGVNGTANVDGTAFVSGSVSGRAFKQGNWGTKKSGVALMGELGRETIVRDGKFFTVGDSGAGFYKYKKGDIIFNHKQTEELFKNGKVTSGGGRAKALVSGTAFADGTESKTVVVGTNANTGKTYTKSSDSDSSKDFEETFDLIEIAISRIERAIDKLDIKANSVYKSWSSRNNALSKEINKVGEQITLQEKAANEYLSAANGVGLSSDWVEKVQNGQVDITTVKDGVLAEKIKDYQTYYELYLDCIDAAEELRETEAELYAQRFEHVQKQYDGILQGYEHTEAMLNEYISQAEEKGHVVSKKYYQALINNEKANISELKKQQDDLIAKRDEAVDSGAIKKGSEEW